MCQPRIRAVAAALCLHAAGASGEPPLNIQQLLVADERWQLLSAVDYRSLPGVAGTLERSAQAVVALRYGAGPALELNTRLHSGEFERRLPGAGLRTRYDGLAAGANWLLKPETSTPALLLEGSLQVYERVGELERHLSAGDVALTAYRSIDPVVLSLTGAVALRRSYREARRSAGAVHSWSLAPQVSFAVNHRVTLSGGLVFAHSDAQRFDGVRSGWSSEALALRAGLGYALTLRSTLFLQGDFASGVGGNRVSLRWFHTF